jgi:hypothetical protein
MEEIDQVEGTSTEIKDPAAVLAALERAKAEAKKFRLEKEELEKQLNTTKEQGSTIRTKLLSEKITTHLDGLGLANSSRLIKYLKINELSLDEDFNVIGLEDQINSLKSDFPELFDAKILVAGKANSGQATPIEKKLSASEMQAKIALGR